MGGCTPSMRWPNSLAVLQIHLTPSGPRMSQGSSITLLVSVSTTALVHSFGVVCVNLSMLVISVMACCAASRVATGMGSDVATVLFCCCMVCNV
jgi:hypothetical protein